MSAPVPRPIPFHDFGGGGPLIHLAHANGYPPAVYRRMVEPLLDHHRVIGIHQRPLWPGEPWEGFESWHVLGRDLADFLDEHGLRGIVGLGHSLGGVATMYAALERPELFRALVLIEPVFLPPALLEGAEGLDEDALAERVPLIAATRGRRTHWPDRASAFEHFRAKPVFAAMSDEALWDYVDGALMPAAADASAARGGGSRDEADLEGDDGDPRDETDLEEGEGDPRDETDVEHVDGRSGGGLTLVCPREWEVRIYSTPPTDVWARVGGLTQPTLAVKGADTDTIRPQAWALWKAEQPEAEFRVVPDCGHLLTFERPREVGRLVRDFVARLDWSAVGRGT